jgi:hypothetical protein
MLTSVRGNAKNREDASPLSGEVSGEGEVTLYGTGCRAGVCGESGSRRGRYPLGRRRPLPVKPRWTARTASGGFCKPWPAGLLPL